jgi:hypothetical protein
MGPSPSSKGFVRLLIVGRSRDFEPFARQGAAAFEVERPWERGFSMG